MLNRRRSLTLVAVILLGVLAAGWSEYRSWQEASLPLSATVTFVIKPGTPLNRVADELAGREIIHHAWELKLLARLRGDTSRIQAGEYRIEPGMTLADVLQMFVSGRVLLHSLTIVEGTTWRELRKLVERSDLLEHTMTGLDDEEIMRRLGHPGENPEGRFLPETYRFPRGTSDLQFLERAHVAMRHSLAQAWAQRRENLPYDEAYDALIMASIIEKETAVPEERGKIAGVFVRRLEKGMRLETDPTVIYGLGEKYDGDIRNRDLRQDTPYNTYRHRGLPPTPICMPGIDAIRAAVNPVAGDELYFVATGDGHHKFSSTYEEHRQAVRKYQSKRNPLPEEEQ